MATRPCSKTKIIPTEILSLFGILGPLIGAERTILGITEKAGILNLSLRAAALL
jgi:hypothetical protein